MKELLNTWINLEEEYNGKDYRLIKCPLCKLKNFIRPGSHIPIYCPYCGIKLIHETLNSIKESENDLRN